MAAVAAVLDSRAALSGLRRSLPAGAGPVVAFRSARGLERGLAERLFDAVVLGTRAAREVEPSGLRARFPTIPILIYGAVRSDDGAQLLAWQKVPIAGIAVEGVEDAVVGDLIVRAGATARRRASLGLIPRRLRLTEPVQLRAWERLIASPGRPPRTSTLARELGLSREHLSRQFGAGGAPNLKRVTDLLVVLSALDLLENPGYRAATVARLLGFASPGHLRSTVRRVVGVGLEASRGLGRPEVVRRFAALAARSRA